MSGFGYLSALPNLQIIIAKRTTGSKIKMQVNKAISNCTQRGKEYTKCKILLSKCKNSKK